MLVSLVTGEATLIGFWRFGSKPSRIIREFASASSGNVAMMFAILLFPLVAATGIAIDMLRSRDANSNVLEAADAAVLAAARAKLQNPDLADNAASDIARRMFDANIRQYEGLEIQSFQFSKDTETGLFRVKVSGALKTSLLRITGLKALPVDIVAEARSGKPRALEVVLALDNTGSMAGSKMTALRSAADELVMTIMIAGPGNETKVGIVPFSRHVNLGKARASEPWLFAPPPSTYSGEQCTVDTHAAASAGCYTTTSTCYNDGVPYSCTTWSCPAGDPPQSCVTVTHPIAFEGCVGSRPYPLNIEDRDFLANPVPGVLNFVGYPDCPTIITPLTKNRSLVLDEISKMTATGETYLPGGLTWSLRLISSEVPFTEGLSYKAMEDENGIKAIVLMTDGENTASPWPGADSDHYHGDKALADDYTLKACAEVKKKKIELYTIAFDVSDVMTQKLLHDCASSSDHSFKASDASELKKAFSEIAGSLTELALTK